MKRIQSILFLIIIFLLPQACKKDKAEAPPPDPIAAYNFDNDWLTNSMSSLLHGSKVGNFISTSDSFLTVAKTAILLSGEGYVRVKDSDLLDFGGNQFTIAAWIRPTNTKYAYIVIKDKDANSLPAYSLDIFPGVVHAMVRTNTDEMFSIDGKSPITEQLWQHIAVTFTGKQLTVYYNGKPEGSVAVDRPLAINTGNLSIGAKESSFPGASMFWGKIDNVKIYDKALTAGQVNYLYKNYKL
jgi:arabinan endo-1,5-alpha-L-arabinosidase